jgi:hypothetical protein
VILRTAFVVVIAGLVCPALGWTDAAATPRHSSADVLVRRDVAPDAVAPVLASADERPRSTDRTKPSKAPADPADVIALAVVLLACAISVASMRRARVRPGLGASSRSPPLLQPV